MSAQARRTVMIVAGEYSGDRLGGEVMAALKGRAPGRLRFVGVGGPAMAEEGLESLFPLDDIAVMGLGDVLPSIGRILARLRAAAVLAEREAPDLLLTIDSLGFNGRLARRVRAGRPGMPILHYAAPKLWAWLPGRARKLKGVYDELLCLFPFEPDFFAGFGLPATFVGHPVVTRVPPDPVTGAAFRARHGIAADAPLLAVLPGSRTSEVTRLLPVFGETLNRLRADHPGLWTVTPTVPSQAARIGEALATWGERTFTVTGEAEKFAAFHAADAALAASGTVSLELAAAGTPMVVAYRVGALSAAIAQRLIRVRYATLVNILLDRPVVPELLQDACTPDRLSAAVRRLLNDETARQDQRAAFAEAMEMLGRGGRPPAERAAEAIARRLGL
ncbi:lipid-A-disaccharide synthase [Futiania mangrovi]|uniref:Lipid-A-disaccharide synthase n=1 Tax=Futiania mangrovi TaxID=2959716 RepID=A0A9J6P894_9PROT|nr:lipid-A-disaccharide synthase [Futiania mangrovii]MCP1335812.1 lipid-A-disaccharide synthase [Futiania mangrovii]